MQLIAIVLLSILAAVIYGVCHDQITARVCVEYFTIGHPPIFATADPTLLGIGWGIVATWWVGLILGIPLALAARAGKWPKRSVASLITPICILLIIMGIAAFGAGVLGYYLARADVVALGEPLYSRVPKSKHVLFIADLWAHLASYLVGTIGGLALSAWLLIDRRRAGALIQK